MKRTTTILRGVSVMVLLSVLVGCAGTQDAPDLGPQAGKKHDLERATLAYGALEEYFLTDHGLYLEEYPNTTSNPYAYVWPFSQALTATADMTTLPRLGAQYQSDLDRSLEALELYWNSATTPPGYDSYVRPPLGGGGDKFYDDNEWLALEFLRLYDRTKNDAYLTRAKEIFELVVYGWDDDPSHPCPGGVFWTQAGWSNDRNTISNAPGAQIGAQLFELTGETRYLDWAKRMVAWTDGCMLAPNGLYWDHINLEGVVEKTQWSYNQGMMIGAKVLLYQATGDESYLRQAQNIASAALEFYGSAGRYYTQPARFNAIFFKNLLLLSEEAPNPAYRKAMQNYADEVWRSIREPETNLFKFEGDNPVTLLEQAAMVQIYATLACTNPTKAGCKR